MEDQPNGNGSSESSMSLLDEALADASIETAIEIAKETMTGDLRDTALQWIRSLQKPWAQLGEEEQRNVISSITLGCTMAATRAVGIIAADKPGAVEATLESYTGKDGLKLVFTCVETEANLIALLRAKGTRVVIASADPARFIGERAEVKPEPDQRLIPGTEGEAASA